LFDTKHRSDSLKRLKKPNTGKNRKKDKHQRKKNKRRKYRTCWTGWTPIKERRVFMKKKGHPALETAKKAEIEREKNHPKTKRKGR